MNSKNSAENQSLAHEESEINVYKSLRFPFPAAV